MPASEATVKARDAAILRLLASGPKSVAVLRDGLPMEEGVVTEEQRQMACSNALTRLSIKKQVRKVEDGWALAG